MSVSEGFVTVNDKIVKLRLHVHQDPDKTRTEYWGGPKGHGYIEGSMNDIQHVADHKPLELTIGGLDEGCTEWLRNITWNEAEVMWKQADYVHGIVHIEWD